MIINANALFTASANLGYHIFVVANKFISVFVRAFRKSDAPGHYISKSGCRLENCYAAASLILHCSRWRSKSFLFNSLWHYKLQRRHTCNKLIWISSECTFEFEFFGSNTSILITYWTLLVMMLLLKR